MIRVEIYLINKEEDIFIGNIFRDGKCEYTILKNNTYTITKCYGIQRIFCGDNIILNKEDARDFMHEFREAVFGGNVDIRYLMENEQTMLLFEDFIY